MNVPEFKYLLVDFDKSIEMDGFTDHFQPVSDRIQIDRICSLEELSESKTSSVVVGMAVVMRQFSSEISEVLSWFQRNVGCFPDYQIMICDDPDPSAMMNSFEFGVEQFTGTEEWMEAVVQMAEKILKDLSDKNSTAYKCIMLNQAVQSANRNAITEREKGLSEDAGYDPIAAFSRGKALESIGNFEEALKSYEGAEAMNSFFRPAQNSIGESLLLSGQPDKAIEVLSRMEGANSSHADRKLLLANAFMEKGDLPKAREYLEEAKSLNADGSRALESRILLLLAEKKIPDAVRMIDSLKEAGPHLASKLNALGVRFSQAGKFKNALTIYNKAHKIVRKELRYKVSLNAALACHRARNFTVAMKFLSRCEQEYGSSFPKLDKIKRAIIAEKNKEA
ncbi:MAG: tetratricopeptide repeat protein [Deltaproteobacteria bacterium]|nr:tetratricopeptide repeat protein [Deltaproteobacteria bacterium]